jgi:hypothetical protein
VYVRSADISGPESLVAASDSAMPAAKKALKSAMKKSSAPRTMDRAGSPSEVSFGEATPIVSTAVDKDKQKPQSPLMGARRRSKEEVDMAQEWRSNDEIDAQGGKNEQVENSAIPLANRVRFSFSFS